MMFTPCWPSARPTGNAGLAAPAGIWSFTSAVTVFFAIVSPRLLERLHLQEVQLHRRRAPEDGHHHLGLAGFHLPQDAFDLALLESGGLVLRPDEARDSRNLLHEEARLLVHVHLD